MRTASSNGMAEQNTLSTNGPDEKKTKRKVPEIQSGMDVIW